MSNIFGGFLVTIKVTTIGKRCIYLRTEDYIADNIIALCKKRDMSKESAVTIDNLVCLNLRLEKLLLKKVYQLCLL